MRILNKKAQFNYKLFERFEAGISLTGIEVRTLKTKGADLSNSYVKILGNEAFLINANIPIEKEGNDSIRTRKLLLHKDEIISLNSKIKSKKLTLVPIKMYNKGRKIKLEIALAKAKHKFEKKEDTKRKDLERQVEEAIKEKV